MRVQESIVCMNEGCDRSDLAFASMSSTSGVEIRCYACGFELLLQFEPHPKLGKIVWRKEEEE